MIENNFLNIKIPTSKNQTGRIIDINQPVSYINISTSQLGLRTKTISKLLLVFVLIGLVFLTFRLVVVQIYTASIWQEWASRSSNQLIYIIPPRGRILDTKGNVIVDSKVSFSMVTSLKNLRDQSKRDLIKMRLNLSESDLDELVGQGYAGFVKLKESMSMDEMLSLADITDKLEIELIPEYTRSYLDKNTPNQQYKIESLAPIIGYTGLPNEKLVKNLDKNIYKSDSRVGLSGLENVYENELQGIPGKVERRSTISNNKNTQDKIITDPILGKDLKTTIDLDLQLRIYDLVQDEFNQAQIKSGSVILMNADTGAIRAMMNFPSYNPSSFEDRDFQYKLKEYFSDPLRPLFNRNTKGQYPPGSSIKPFVGAIALQNNIIKPNQEILDTGTIKVKSKIIEGRVDQYINYKTTYFGVIDLATALEKSSDVFFYYLVGGDPETGKIPYIDNPNTINPIGIDRFDEDMIRYFGFGLPTGIDLESENRGVIPTPKYKESKGFGSWFLGDTYQSAIGQGFFLTTPLQLTRATAVIANGGKLVTPYLRQDKTIEVRDSGLRDDVIEYIQNSMRSVVTDGTAKRLLENDSKIAGKTGSAQFDPNQRDRVYGWVISYNQSQDVVNEKLVLVVLTEDIDKTAEYITVPITNKIWQSIEYQYKVNNGKI